MTDKPTQVDHGRKGGQMTSTNFARNKAGASAAGKVSKRGPAVLECDWCDAQIRKTNGKGRPTLTKLMDDHKRIEHPKLYAKFVQKRPIE